MKISAEGLALIKKFEGCELTAYQCSAGVWTIGYGHTKGVEKGMTISKESAEEMLIEELHEYEGYITDNVTSPLSQNQFDAMVSWVYNLGPSNLLASTLLKVPSKRHNFEIPKLPSLFTVNCSPALMGTPFSLF